MLPTQIGTRPWRSGDEVLPAGAELSPASLSLRRHAADDLQLRRFPAGIEDGLPHYRAVLVPHYRAVLVPHYRAVLG